MQRATEVAYVYNGVRAHKLIPLLGQLPVFYLKGWRDAAGMPHGPGVVVVADNFGKPGLLGLFAATFRRLPFVIRLRGEFFREERERAATNRSSLRWAKYLLNNLLAWVCLRRASMVICNSRYLADAMAPYLKGKKIAVVRNPYTALGGTSPQADLDALPDGGLRLLSVTNMHLHSKVQPIREAIENWMPPELWEELDVRWVIYGAGPHEEGLKKFIIEKGLEDRVRLLGKVRVTPDIYRWCDVVVHLTRMDAFPNVPMEGMMNDRPVITNADSCGTREQVFDGENGFVVDDGASFVSALADYAKDPALRGRHARAGRTLVEERFSVDEQRSAMEAALGELFSKAGR